jgi:hypothetical protein
MKQPWIWLVVVANLVGLIALAFVYPSAMVSPGALVPAHAELEDKCGSCHAPFRGASPDRCVQCHSMTDIGVRTTRGAPVEFLTERTISASFHQELTEQNCAACHSEHGRLIERRFSHALLRPAARGQCATCHASPTNELHRDLRMSCSQCHTTEHWSPATFDHASLPSATLARCQSCHSAPTDSFHRQNTAACTQCHSTQRWSPSTFDHRRFFVLDGAHEAACATCHTNNDFTRYTCFGCHEHTPENIRAEHEEEGIRNRDDCVSCHRSAEGEGGEGREGGRGEEDD